MERVPQAEGRWDRREQGNLRNAEGQGRPDQLDEEGDDGQAEGEG